VGATAATAAKVGISPDSWTNDVRDLLLLLIAGGTWLIAHVQHGKPGSGAPVVTGQSGIKLGLMLIFGLMMAGAARAQTAVITTNLTITRVGPFLYQAPDGLTVTNWGYVTNVVTSTNYVEVNASGGITTLSNLIAQAGTGVAQVANDSYNVFKNISLTNPITAGVIFLRNGSKSGFGLEAGSVDTNSLVNVGFGVFAIQTKQPTASGGTATHWGFYDATVNLSVSKVETLPIFNIPIEMKIESGPAVRLSSGGNTLMEQTAGFGDITFDPIGGWPLTIGGGIVNAVGSGLRPVMPFLHFNFSHTF
jgi:hypothetical protein